MNQENNEVTAIGLIKQIYHKSWIIVLMTVILSISAYLITTYKIPNLYASEATIFIGKESGALAEFNFLDLQIGSQLIEDYKELIKTKTLREEVAKQVDPNIDIEILLKRIDVKTVEDSRFMIISAIDRDPYVATRLANTIAEVLIVKAEDIIGAKNIQIVDIAVPNFEPVSPNIITITLIFSILGIMLGIITIVILILFDTKINSQSEIEELVNVPILGQLQSVKNSTPHDEMVMIYKKNTFDSELYKLIRTNLDFMSVDKKFKTIMVTSSQSSEGKSTTIANIAVAFAQIGRRVLLIDADLRKPRVNKLFNVSNAFGLVNQVVGKVDLSKVIKVSSVNNLYVLPSGPKPPNPNEILMSNQIELLIDKAASAFDIVLIDSPPLLSVADSLTLARCVDGIVIIAASKGTKKEDLVKSVRNIEKINKPIIGVILTKVKMKNKKYYYY